MQNNCYSIGKRFINRNLSLVNLINSDSFQAIKNQICFYRGYAGWNKNQLEQEIHSGTWILAPCDTATILSQPPEQLWHNLVYSLGGYYRAVAEMPEDPSVN